MNSVSITITPSSSFFRVFGFLSSSAPIHFFQPQPSPAQHSTQLTAVTPCREYIDWALGIPVRTPRLGKKNMQAPRGLGLLNPIGYSIGSGCTEYSVDALSTEYSSDHLQLQLTSALAPIVVVGESVRINPYSMRWAIRWKVSILLTHAAGERVHVEFRPLCTVVEAVGYEYHVPDPEP
jgi:hypothetical protein